MTRTQRGEFGPSFLARVQKTETCWLWMGPRTRLGGRAGTGGYGKWGNGMAHRVAYEALVGPIPEGLQLDHLCEVTNCVNPAHLEPVTGLENLRRWQERNPYCKRGHLLAGDNLRITNSARGQHRRCRECVRMTNAAFEARRRNRTNPPDGEPATWLELDVLTTYQERPA